MMKLIVVFRSFAKKVIFDVSGVYMNLFFLYSENTTKKIHRRSKFNSTVIVDVEMNVTLKVAKILFGNAQG
jgi:hypothetical protein